jgi:hypothetical protein
VVARVSAAATDQGTQRGPAPEASKGLRSAGLTRLVRRV